MTKYVKKPVKVNAWQLTTENIEAGLPVWLDLDKVHIFGGDAPFAEIETLEGLMKASYGDFIIQGIKGELYPCKPDIFLATYDKAPELHSNDEEDLMTLTDFELEEKIFAANSRRKRLGKENYRRKLLKQVEGKGVEFGKSVIKVEGMNGEYFVPSMTTQLSRYDYAPYPMIALQRITERGVVSNKLQYIKWSRPNVMVVGEYDFGQEAGVKYND